MKKQEKYYITANVEKTEDEGYMKEYETNTTYMEQENQPLTEKDVIDIRTRYNNKERCKEVESLYSDRIGHSGFSKIWKGETW